MVFGAALTDLIHDMNNTIDSDKLQHLYRTYNHKRFAYSDPVEFLYRYDHSADREIVGLVASSLAYGRVAQIRKSISRVLEVMGKNPRRYVEKTGLKSIEADFAGFVHRFASDTHICALIAGIQSAIKTHGSLQACFLEGFHMEHVTVWNGLQAFSEKITAFCAGMNPGHLIPIPGKKSACKRLNLYLRWMVRKDAIDPGGWDAVPPSRLVIPLDTHMHRFGLGTGMTARRQADVRTALEVTEAFRKIVPQDPVRYDFVLTRAAIAGKLNPADFVSV